MRSKQRQFDMANLQGAKLSALSHLPKNRCDVRICSPQGQQICWPDLASSLLTATNLIVGRSTASAIADASMKSFLLPLT